MNIIEIVETAATYLYRLARNTEFLMNSFEIVEEGKMIAAISSQILPSARNIAIGCTEFSVTKPLARVIGPAGTARQLSSSVWAVCSTTRKLTLATGRRMSEDVKNIVSTASQRYILMGYTVYT